jgi:hypothetical protein
VSRKLDSSSIMDLKPRHLRGFLFYLSVRVRPFHRTERKLLGWSVGHQRRTAHTVQMTSPGPCAPRSEGVPSGGASERRQKDAPAAGSVAGASMALKRW